METGIAFKEFVNFYCLYGLSLVFACLCSLLMTHTWFHHQSCLTLSAFVTQSNDCTWFHLQSPFLPLVSDAFRQEREVYNFAQFFLIIQVSGQVTLSTRLDVWSNLITCDNTNFLFFFLRKKVFFFSRKHDNNNTNNN